MNVRKTQILLEILKIINFAGVYVDVERIFW